MFDWEKAKVVEIKKPDLGTGKTEDEQKNLYDVILAYYCWLHIRTDLNRGENYTHKLRMRSKIGVADYCPCLKNIMLL